MNPEVFEQVRDLEIRSKLLIQDIFAGAYHSAFKGSGLNFAEVREYSSGDDIRKLDRNVTARTGKPYIKLHEEEREVSVLLAIDASQSTSFKRNGKSIRSVLNELSGVLALSAAKNKDKVGLVIFSDKIEKYIAPRSGRNHVMRILFEIFAFQATSKKTSIGSVAKFLLTAVKKKAVVFLLSDFLDQNYHDSVKRVCLRHDVIAIQISATFDWQYHGIIEVEDSESGETFFLNTADKKNRQIMNLLSDKQRQLAAKSVLRPWSHSLHITLEEDHFGALRNFFFRRNRSL